MSKMPGPWAQVQAFPTGPPITLECGELWIRLFSFLLHVKMRNNNIGVLGCGLDTISAHARRLKFFFRITRCIGLVQLQNGKSVAKIA